MKKTDDKTLLLLNGLIQIGKDAEQGFQRAADSARNPDLARIFSDYASQRTKFIVELQKRVRALRGTPPKTGTPMAIFHRGWMDFQAALASNDPHAILNECEKGEDVAVKAYVEALKESDLDDQSRAIVQRQYEAVQAAHDRVRQLRDTIALPKEAAEPAEAEIFVQVAIRAPWKVSDLK